MSSLQFFICKAKHRPETNPHINAVNEWTLHLELEWQQRSNRQFRQNLSSHILLSVKPLIVFTRDVLSRQCIKTQNCECTNTNSLWHHEWLIQQPMQWNSLRKVRPTVLSNCSKELKHRADSSVLLFPLLHIVFLCVEDNVGRTVMVLDLPETLLDTTVLPALTTFTQSTVCVSTQLVIFLGFERYAPFQDIVITEGSVKTNVRLVSNTKKYKTILQEQNKLQQKQFCYISKSLASIRTQCSLPHTHVFLQMRIFLTYYGLYLYLAWVY